MPIHDFSQLSTPLFAGNQDLRLDGDKLDPIYSVYDQNSKDIGSTDRIASELMNVYGAIVQLFIRTNNYDVDGVWDEDSDPTYWNPVTIRAFFVPKPIEKELTDFGADIPDNSTIIFFVRNQIYGLFGDRLLRPGDLVNLPYNSLYKEKPKYYHINNAQESENYRYNWLYLACQASLVDGDPHIRPANDEIKKFGNLPESMADI